MVDLYHVVLSLKLHPPMKFGFSKVFFKKKRQKGLTCPRNMIADMCASTFLSNEGPILGKNHWFGHVATPITRGEGNVSTIKFFSLTRHFYCPNINMAFVHMVPITTIVTFTTNIHLFRYTLYYTILSIHIVSIARSKT